jgi:hypothetical protein
MLASSTGRFAERGRCDDSSMGSGRHTCVPRGKSKPCGMTPMMVCVRPSSEMVLPAMSRSLARRERQKA